MLYRKIGLGLLLLSLTIFAYAQNQFVFNNYNTAEGLSCPRVNKLTQDKYGFIWIATIEGLARFDGYQFKNFKPNPSVPQGIRVSSVHSLFADRDGVIWFGDKKLSFYDSDNDQFVELNNPAFSEEYNNANENDITSITQDEKGNLWYIARRSGLTCYNVENRKFINIGNLFLNDSTIETWENEIVIDKDQFLYACYNKKKSTKGKLLRIDLNAYYRNHAIVRSEYELPERNTNVPRYQQMLFSSKAESLYLCFASDLYSLNTKAGTNAVQKDKNGKIGKALLNHQVHCMFADHMNNYWFGTEAGLFFYDIHQDSIFQFKNNPLDPGSLQTDDITNIFEDSFGNLWVGTWFGVSKIYLQRKPFFRLDEKFSNLKLLHYDSANILWIATDKGLHEVDEKTNMLTHSYVNRPDLPQLFLNQITSIERYEKDFYLLGGININKVNFRKNIFEYANPTPHDSSSLVGWSPLKIYRSPSTGIYWVGTFNGLCKINKPINKIKTAPKGQSIMEEKFTSYRYNPKDSASIASGRIWEIFEDKEKTLWIGTNNGLSRFNPKENNFLNFRRDVKNPRSLPNSSITMLYEDSKKRFWICTEGGLALMDREKGTFKYIEEIGKKLSNIVWGILEDNQGNLWVITVRGFCKYNPERNEVKLFNKYDGSFDVKECYRNSFCKTDNGKFYIGTDCGIIYFYPNSIKENPYPPKVLLTGLSLFNKPVSIGESVNGNKVLQKSMPANRQLTFNYKNNNISLEFVGLNYTNVQHTRYAYRMEGFDKEWIYTDQRLAHYANLPSGEYYFHVKAMNYDGVWNKDHLAGLKIIVLPPWWETWWFRILVVLLIVSGVYIFFRWRLRSLNWQKKVLESQVRERTAEIENMNEELHVQADHLREVNHTLTIQKEEISQQAAELEKVNATKDKFFSIIGHDLKNPFHAIISLSEILLADYDDMEAKKVKEFIAMIQESSAGASDLLMNLLQWANTQTNNIEMKPVLFNLHEMVKSVFILLTPNANQKQLSLQNNVLAEVGLYADANMINTVIRNLVNNAIKYTPEEGTVIVSSEMEQDKLIIFVSDNGIGMDQQTCSALFRIDKHLSTPGTKGETGTGLGLIICKEFIEHNGGTIAVESQLAKGTQFKITMPGGKKMAPLQDPSFETLQKKQTNNFPEVQKEIKQENKEDFSEPISQEDQPLLLVVEDNEKIRQGILSYFKRSYKIIISENGQEGIEAAINECPDIIISDVNMPFMDGFEMCNRIKNDERTSHIPLILLTSNSGETPTIKGYNTGADDYVTKPFSMKVLEARLKNLLDTRRKLRDIFSRQLPAISNTGLSKMDKEFLQKLISFIENNISNSDLNADMLVTEMAMSKRNLYRKLKAITNQPVHEFIKIVRLKKAAEILQSGESNVSEVAYMVGFQDRSHFSTSFKKMFGKSPSEYR